jgi:hypothetical protein
MHLTETKERGFKQLRQGEKRSFFMRGFWTLNDNSINSTGFSLLGKNRLCATLS